MAEPLFFDCLTDAQFWSLFDCGVLHAYMLPAEVYERLGRIAPAHGCYLFTWPAGVQPPALQDIVPRLAATRDPPADQTQSQAMPTRLTPDGIRSAIEVLRAHVHIDLAVEGERIHVISTSHGLELRAGPHLEPPARDLSAMSLPELEAYLDAVLQLDAERGVDSAAPSTSQWGRIVIGRRYTGSACDSS